MSLSLMSEVSVVVGVGYERHVFHEAQYLVAIPFGAMGDCLVCAGLHLLFVRLEKLLQHPRRRCE